MTVALAVTVDPTAREAVTAIPAPTVAVTATHAPTVAAPLTAAATTMAAIADPTSMESPRAAFSRVVSSGYRDTNEKTEADTSPHATAPHAMSAMVNGTVQSLSVE